MFTIFMCGLPWSLHRQEDNFYLQTGLTQTLDKLSKTDKYELIAFIVNKELCLVANENFQK